MMFCFLSNVCASELRCRYASQRCSRFACTQRGVERPGDARKMHTTPTHKQILYMCSFGGLDSELCILTAAHSARTVRRPNVCRPVALVGSPVRERTTMKTYRTTYRLAQCCRACSGPPMQRELGKSRGHPSSAHASARRTTHNSLATLTHTINTTHICAESSCDTRGPALAAGQSHLACRASLQCSVRPLPRAQVA